MQDFKVKLQNFKMSLRRNGRKAEIRRLKNYIKYKKTVPDEYKEWMILNEPDEDAFENEKKYVSPLNTDFSIIVNDEKSIENIGEQTYNKFETVILNPDKYLEYIEKCNSDFCIFMGNDIKFQPFTVFAVQDFIEHNYCNILYSDNDYIIDGKRTDPDFKPHFAYDNILSKNYFGNFLVVRTKFLKAHKEILKDLSKKETIYDLILRITEITKAIMHIDMILFHKLQENIDTEEQKKIIKEHFDRIGEKYDSIDDGDFTGQYKINYKILEKDKVSIVIPNMDHIDDLKKCIDSILKSTYENYEIIVVENNSKEESTFKFYKELEKNNKIKIVKMNISEFNYSKIVNFGVQNSSGKYIIMLNNDIEIINSDWIEQMLMYVQKENIGICGARLYFSDDSIQHAGVIIGIRGLAGHRYRCMNKSEFTSKDNISYVQDLNAVTAACFMVKRSDYDHVLGFDEKLAVAFNDVDFCLKIRKENKMIIYNPFVQAYHYESKSRGEDTVSEEKQRRFAREYEIFVKRWARVLNKGDRYFNANYRLDTDIPSINYNKI